MTVVAWEDLQGFAAACLRSVGVDDDDAATVADVLVCADLRAIRSHGCARLRRYVDGIGSGAINVRPRRRVDSTAAAVAVVDADNGLGQPVAVAAMGMAIERAERLGLGAVAVRRSNHFGIAGYYAALAADRGLVGVATTNASPQVAPTFGARPMYGTNPLAVAVPAAPRPFLLDMATSVVPRGRLERMVWDDEPMPDGWAIGPDGRPATDKRRLIEGLKARDGHALHPLGGAGETYGGHKGFGLGLLVDMLCGPLAGAAWGRHVYGDGGANLGHFFLALQPGAFRPADEFAADIAAQLTDIRATPTAAGHDRVFLAGDKEYAAEAERRRHGIPLSGAVWDDLGALAEQTAVALPARLDVGEPV